MKDLSIEEILLERIVYKCGCGLSSFSDEEISEMLGFIYGYSSGVRMSGFKQGLSAAATLVEKSGSGNGVTILADKIRALYLKVLEELKEQGYAS